MSQISSVTRPELLGIPNDILSVMPTDPHDQLELARKITSLAISTRVSNLESETETMQLKIQEKDRVIHELEERVKDLQRACQDAETKLKIVLEDSTKIAKERDSLAMTTKKLGRDLAKLETFKRQLMRSLNDENSFKDENVENASADQSMPTAPLSKGEAVNGYTHNGPANCANTADEALKFAGQKFSMTSYITPRLTPTGTPKVISAAVSPRQTSGSTTPTKYQSEGRPALSWYSTSQQSSAANSPPRGRSQTGHAQRIDGKEFFRQARNRLSYEQFGAFLTNIKDLNAQKQSREETLKKAEDIFGTENRDLYISFQGLLSRNMR